MTTADRIRLLYLRDTKVVCGPGKTILNTWRTLDSDRFALTIASTQPRDGATNALLERAESLRADVLPFGIGAGFDVGGAWRLADVLRRGRFDILQTHDSQTRRIGVVAARLAGVLHVTSVHGWIFNTRKEWAARWLDQRLIGLSDHVITISDTLGEAVVAAGTPRDRVTVLRNAILLEDYTTTGSGAALRREFGIPDGHTVVSIIGRLSPEKGHAVFLEAARAVASRSPNVTFLIVGDGPLRHDLEREAAAGLEGRVVFTGHRTDMAAVYDATSIVALSSFTEGIPNVLLEGFAYRRPAVATAVGGVPEIMSNGVEGWIVPAGRADQLADRLIGMLDEPMKTMEMGNRARQAIETKFDFRLRTRELERVYERLTFDRRRKGAA